MANKLIVMTPPVLINFPDLFVPKPKGGQAGQPEVYSVLAAFKKTEWATPAWQPVKDAIAAAMEEEFGAGASRDKDLIASMKGGDGTRWPVRDGATAKLNGVTADDFTIRPWSKFQPPIVDRNRQDIIDASRVWSGQLARLSVSAFGWTSSGKRGVSFNLEAVQIIKEDMPRLDGRRSGSEQFDDSYADKGGAAPAGASARTADEDIPF